MVHSEQSVKFCPHCGGAVQAGAAICVHCGKALLPLTPTGSENDRPDPGIMVACILIPLLGIVLGAVYASSSPNAARAYSRAGWITILVEVFLIFAAYAGLGAFIAILSNL